MSCEMYTPLEGPDGMLLEINGKLTMWISKSSRLAYSLVKSLPPLSMMNMRSRRLRSGLLNPRFGRKKSAFL